MARLNQMEGVVDTMTNYTIDHDMTFMHENRICGQYDSTEMELDELVDIADMTYSELQEIGQRLMVSRPQIDMELREALLAMRDGWRGNMGLPDECRVSVSLYEQKEGDKEIIDMDVRVEFTCHWNG